MFYKNSLCVAYNICRMKEKLYEKSYKISYKKSSKKLPEKSLLLVANFLKSYQILVRFLVAEPIMNLELCVTESDDVRAIFSRRHKFKILPEILSKILRKISACIRHKLQMSIQF